MDLPRNENDTRAVDPNEALAAKEPYRQKYTQTELAKLYRFCALEPLEMGDYTTDCLPEFWLGFEANWAKNHAARSFVEGWCNYHWAKDAPQYQQFLSLNLIRNLMNLDLCNTKLWCNIVFSCY